jgi:diketogulonate reductase-like aldo/keto reductase
MESIKLYNGVEMPLLGYGMYKVDPVECERCVTNAIKAGYRLIDTAQYYGNEEGVGAAIAKSGIPREEFFIVTKVWIYNSGEERAYASIQESLRKLGTDYADLIFVHQPFGDYYGTYRALERALDEGLTRSIGVSNFRPDKFYDLAHHCRIKPMVNQLETNVFSQQTEMRELMEEYGTKLMAWGPIAQGKESFNENPVLTEIGRKYGKTAVQTGLRFLVQEGIPAIPKSSKTERIIENIDIFDFELTEKEMDTLRNMNETDGGTRDYTSLPYVIRLINQ